MSSLPRHGSERSWNSAHGNSYHAPRLSSQQRGRLSGRQQHGNSQNRQGQRESSRTTNPPHQTPNWERPVSFPTPYLPKPGGSKKIMEEYAMLWEDPTDWDLLVICRDGQWMVHQAIIKREAPEFFDVLVKMKNDENIDGKNDEDNKEENYGQNYEKNDGQNDANDGNEPFTVDLSAWQPAIIGGLLKFIYVGDWQDMDGYPPSATNLRSIPCQVHMAAQAWTLNLPLTVRKVAVSKINRATYQLSNVIKTTLQSHPISPIGYFSIEEPVYQALDFLYQQEEIDVMRYMLPVRAAVSRLTDVAVPWLLKQPAFMQNFQTLWSQDPLYSRWMGDHWKFSQIGCLLPSWEDPPEDCGEDYGEPQVEEPQAEEPKAEEPTAEEPKTKDPKVEELKIEEPKAE